MSLPSIRPDMVVIDDPVVPQVKTEVTEEAKRQVSVKKLNVKLQAMTGLAFGDPKRNVMMRLNRRQAAALRSLVEGWEQEHAESLYGRRANEQDWLRATLDSVADQLGL